MLKIVGDINLTDGYFDVGFGIGSKLKNGLDPFKHISRTSADCWIGNFEGVASETSSKKGNAASQFRVSPTFLRHFKHFDFYGCANNHAMQHGNNAYKNTIEALESLGSKTFGSENKRTQVFVHQGRVVSITGFSQRVDSFSDTPLYWHNPEYAEILDEVRNISNDAFKIVYVHWGNEFINRPSAQQKRFAHWLIDAGYDLVIGMHPHILQGYEEYQGKYIFYSLGNFVFDMPWEPTKYGAIVSIDLSLENIKPNIDYIRISKDYIPMVVEQYSVPNALRFDYLNSILEKDDNSEEYHIEINKYYRLYRKANHKDIFRKMINHPKIIYGIIRDYISRRF